MKRCKVCRITDNEYLEAVMTTAVSTVRQQLSTIVQEYACDYDTSSRIGKLSRYIKKMFIDNDAINVQSTSIQPVEDKDIMNHLRCCIRSAKRPLFSILLACDEREFDVTQNKLKTVVDGVSTYDTDAMTELVKIAKNIKSVLSEFHQNKK